MLHALCVNNTWMKLQLCEQICTSDYLNKEMLIITVWICREKFWVTHTHKHTHTHTHTCTHISLWSVRVCMLAWSLSAVPPHMNRAEPCAVDSCLLWKTQKQKKSLKSSALPLSCVHLIRLFLTLLSLHSAPAAPGAAACYHAEFNLWSPMDSLAASECFREGEKKKELCL